MGRIHGAVVAVASKNTFPEKTGNKKEVPPCEPLSPSPLHHLFFVTSFLPPLFCHLFFATSFLPLTSAPPLFLSPLFCHLFFATPSFATPTFANPCHRHHLFFVTSFLLPLFRHPQ